MRRRAVPTDDGFGLCQNRRRARKPVLVGRHITQTTGCCGDQRDGPSGAGLRGGDVRAGFGFRPLCAFVDHGRRGHRGTPGHDAAAGQCRAEHRGRSHHGDPGRVAAVTPRRHGWADRAEVLIRADSGGGTHEVIEWLSARHLSSSPGFALTEETVSAIAMILRSRLDVGL